MWGLSFAKRARKGAMRKRSSKPKGGKKGRGWVGVLIALALVAVALFGWQAWRLRLGAAPVSETRIAEQHSWGPANAEVTIIEYADFDCPTCKAYYNSDTLQRMVRTYPNSGPPGFPPSPHHHAGISQAGGGLRVRRRPRRLLGVPRPSV